MKKLISILCVFVLCVTCLAGCGEGSAKARAEKWNTLAENGVAEELASMYLYLNYICNWDDNRMQVNEKSVYIDPYTAAFHIINEDSAFYYAYEEGYFDALAEKINSLGDDYSAVAANVEKAKALSDKAFSALANREYTFSNETGKYTLNNSEEIKSEYNALYSEYIGWRDSQSL